MQRSDEFNFSQIKQPLADLPPNSSHPSEIMNAATGMMLQLPDSTIAACNPRAAEILGYSAEQLVGVTSFDLPWKTIQSDDSFPLEEYPAIAAMRSGQPVLNVVMGFYRPNGELVSLKLDSQPLFRVNEAAPYAVVTTITDVTEQNRPLSAASATAASPTQQNTEQTSEANLRLFIKYAPACLAMFDRNMRYVALSQRWVEVYQLNSVEEIVGRSHYEIFPQIPERWRQAHDRALAGEIQKCEEDSFRLPDGCLQWLRWEIRPWHTDSGEIGGIVIFVEDITERKSAEATVRRQLAEIEAIYTAAPIGLCFVDTDLRFIRINEQLAQINGLPVPEHLGRTLRQVLPEMADELEPLYRQVIESGEPMLNLEMSGTNQAQPGVERDWLLNYYPQKDISGQVVGVNVMVQEITERKRIERNLHQANQRISTIWESMTDAYLSLDHEWRITYANQAATQVISQLTNLELEVLLSKNFWEVFPWAVGQVFEQQYRRAVKEQVAVHFEALYEPTGKWFEVHAYPSAAGLGIYFRDISDASWQATQRKSAEVALRESEHRYRTLFETMDQGFCVCEMLFDKNGEPTDYRFLEINPAFEKMTGLEQATGKTARELVPNLEAFWFETYGRVVLTGEPARFEHQAEAMNRWFDVSAFRVSEAQSHKFAILFTNISERQAALRERKQAEAALQQSQERLSLAIDSAGMATWDIDMQTGRGIWSQSHFPMLGYELVPGSEATFEMWHSRVHEDDLAAVMQALESAQQTRSLYSPEYRIIRADTGEIRWLKAFGRFLYDQTGQAERFIGVLFDTSDRKIAELALVESESWFRTLADNIAQLAWMTDANGWIFWYNQRWFDYTGTTLEAMQGWGWQKVHHPDHIERVVEHFRHCLELGESWEDTFPLRGQDGQYRWFLSRAVPIKDEQGNVVRWFGTNTDISDRKHLEEALRQSNAILNTINESTPTLIYVKDRAGKMLVANPAVLTAVGKPAEAVLGKTTLEFHEPLAEAEKIMNNDRLVMQTGQSHQFEEVLDMVGKRRVFLSVKAPYRDEQGNIIGIIGISSDISDRKSAEAALQQSEERYRYLVESIPQLVWTSDSAGTITDVNQRWSDYTGLTLPQIKTEGWQTVIHPDDLPTLTARWLAAQQAESHYQAEGRMRRVDGTYRWHLHQGIPVKDGDEIIKWFGTATDIDDRVQFEIERNRLLQQEQIAREEAERANRIKDEFLAVLSHELRTPLNPILGWVKLLQTRRFDTTRTTEALATIERNAKLQAQLIEDLLDISRVMGGKLTLNAAPVSLAFVISAAMETVRLAAEAKSIQLIPVLDATTEQVFGDAGRLQQVVWNLLSNAVKFTPVGGQVTILLTQVDADAQIEVIDTGKGINPEFLPYVFEYFRQEDASTTRRFGGLGLGLAIARQIVEMHGGRIRAESAGEDQGTTFTVELPLLKSATPEPQNAVPPLSSEPVALASIQVLIVDDDVDTREFLAFLLQESGATVTAAASGVEALQHIKQATPDVLLSDIGMPEMDGYQLMRTVRSLEQGQNLPAIALTAYAGEINQQQAIAAGFQHHVAKPINPDTVIALIVELVQQ